MTDDLNNNIIPAYGEAGPEADAMRTPAAPANAPASPTGPVNQAGTTETDVERNRADAVERKRALPDRT